MSRGSGRGLGGAKLVGGVIIAATIIGGGWLLFGGSDGPDAQSEGTDLGATNLSASEPAGFDDFVSTGVLKLESSGADSNAPGRPRTGTRLADGDRETTGTTGTVGRGTLAATQNGADNGAGSAPRRSPSGVPNTASRTGTATATGVAALMAEARDHLSNQRLVQARASLNSALRHPDASEQDRSLIRGDMAVLNEDLFFGSKVYEGDPLAFTYTIESGDRLSSIVLNRGLGVDWRLVQRINRISAPDRIRVGQKLKLVQGPMHAIVDKSDYRMDLYAGPPGVPERWIYIRSFSVGLGENDSTPIGRFVVRPDSKLINPVWRNPRTGEMFAADDPENPIGERWVGLEGTGEIEHVEGYGIHGTIEPGSIGSDASMGCIRLEDDAVEVIYEALEEQVSEVIVRP